MRIVLVGRLRLVLRCQVGEERWRAVVRLQALVVLGLNRQQLATAGIIKNVFHLLSRLRIRRCTPASPPRAARATSNQ